MNPLKGKHIALIPDGNRRWAEKNNKDVSEGHKKGSDTLDDFIDWSIIENGVEKVSVYSLSTQNLSKRPAEEVKHLVELYIDRFKGLVDDERIKGSVKVKFPGDLSQLPQKLHETIEYVKEKTKENKEHVINFLLPYGGRYEITRAIKNIAKDVRDKTIDIGEITQDRVQENLLITDNPDIVIRTTERRLSNFLIWQTAYSEIFFVDKYWPEFSRSDFKRIKKKFAQRKRTYGE